MACAKLRAQNVESVPVSLPQTCDHYAQTPLASAAAGMRLACLLKRVFEIDIEQCARCGGRLQIIAAIVDPQVIVNILTYLGLPARAPAQHFPLFQAPSPLSPRPASMPRPAGPLVARSS